MRTGFVLIAALSLTACARSDVGSTAGEAAVQRQSAPAVVAIDNTTPDRTLKTLWALQDQTLKARCDLLESLLADESPEGRRRYRLLTGYPDLGTLVTGNVEKAYNYLSPCDGEIPTMAREITEIKSETESRAVAYFTVKNTTPIPKGAADDKWRTDLREKGDRYKVVLTKVQDGWRVEAVYTRLSADGDWYQQHERPGPEIPFSTSAF
jgi:hypothetical protein